MSLSFLLNVVVCVGSLFGAWLDHGETLEAFKTATGEAKRRRLAKLMLLWGIPVISFLALPVTWRESLDTEHAIRSFQTVSKQVPDLSTRVEQFGEMISSNSIGNQPIQTTEAYAFLLVRPREPVEHLSQLVRNVGGKNIRFRRNPGMGAAWLDLSIRPPDCSACLMADNVTQSICVIGTNEYLRLDVHFAESRIMKRSNGLNSSFTPNNFNAVKLILPVQCDVVEGRIQFLLNSSIERVFEFPPQTSFFSAVTSIAANGVFVPFSPQQFGMQGIR